MAPKQAIVPERAKSMQLLPRFLILVMVASMIYFLLVWFLHSDRFPVKKIKIHGHLKELAELEIEALVSPYMNINFFSLDLFSIQQAVQSLPWVQAVDVERKWPDTILLHVE